MKHINYIPDIEAFKKAFLFRTSRSSGSGGQHINKVSTKVELLFDINTSDLLSDEQKEILLNVLENQINREGVLRVTCDKSRSQLKNKKTAIKKAYQLIAETLKPRKKRKKVNPPKALKEARLKKKKIISEKKELRKKIIL